MQKAFAGIGVLSTALEIKRKSRIINKPKFLHHAPTDMKLTHVVCVYTDGKKWKFVPLSVLVRYPVIHDKYYHEKRSRKSKFLIDTCFNMDIPF